MKTLEEIRKTFHTNLVRLFHAKNCTQKELAEYMKVTPTTVNEWLKGKKIPRMDKVDKLCSFFQVSRSELIDTPTLPPLTAKDERQIANDLENMLQSLDGAAAMGDDPDDEEDRELLKASLLQAMTLSKRLAKKKFTPKKYR